MKSDNDNSSASQSQNNNNNESRSTSSIAKSLAQLHSNIKDRSTYSTTNINTKQIPKKRKKSHLINPNNNKKQHLLKSFGFKHTKVIQKIFQTPVFVSTQNTLPVSTLITNDRQGDKLNTLNQQNIRIAYSKINGLNIGNDNHS